MPQRHRPSAGSGPVRAVPQAYNSTALFAQRLKMPRAWGVRAAEGCGSFRHAKGTILRPVMYRGDPGDTGGCLTGLYGRVKSACDLVRSKPSSSATWGSTASTPTRSASGGFTSAGRPLSEEPGRTHLHTTAPNVSPLKFPSVHGGMPRSRHCVQPHCRPDTPRLRHPRHRRRHRCHHSLTCPFGAISASGSSRCGCCGTQSGRASA